MSGFVCPNCKCQSDIFPPVTGGATKMCIDMGVPLLTQIPLEPKLLLACEAGKCFAKEFPDSITGSKFTEIAMKIKQMKRE